MAGGHGQDKICSRWVGLAWATAVGGAREKKPLVGHWDLAAAVAECEPNASRHGARNWWRGWKGPSCRVTKATRLCPRSWDERHRVLVRLSGSRCTGVLSTACHGLGGCGWMGGSLRTQAPRRATGCPGKSLDQRLKATDRPTPDTMSPKHVLASCNKVAVRS